MRAVDYRAVLSFAMVLAGLKISGAQVQAAGIIGQPAPALSVETLDGQSFDLAARRGKVVIVAFWATWCPPCRSEMPVLDAFYRRYHTQGLELIALSTDDARARSEVVKVMKSFSYPGALADDATANGFGDPSALPVTYVVDTRGIVRARLAQDAGVVTETSLSQAVLHLLPRTDHPS